jgi:hypothetical protein
MLLAGCTQVASPEVTANQTVFTANDTVTISWTSVDDADSYQICFYIFPLSDDRLARSVEQTQTTWEGTLPQGKYDVVVYAMRNEKCGDASEKITVTIEAESVPSWEEINTIFASSNSDLSDTYGEPYAESDTGSELIESYETPAIDVVYKDDVCTRLDIYEPDYILFGLSIGENTQAELLSKLNEEDISYENDTETTTAGSNIYTVFSYNGYQFTVYIDTDNLISYVSLTTE